MQASIQNAIGDLLLIWSTSNKFRSTGRPVWKSLLQQNLPVTTTPLFAS